MAEPIQYQSALTTDLLKNLLGSKQTTSQTSTSTADTAGLQQVLAQQLATTTPEGMQALLGDLFTQGAQQVPALTQAYANATGTRSTGNSGLALSLAELNKDLAGKAAQLSMAQQQAAAQTAAQIAGATKSTTTNQTNATKGNALQSGLLAAGGTLLNKADKAGWLDKGAEKIGSLFGSSSDAGAGAVDFTPNLFTGVQGDSLGFSIPTMDFGSVGSGFGADSLISGAADIGSSLLDSGASLVSGISDSIGGAVSDASDWVSSFFADGGLVTPEHAKSAAAYADGGTVRNRNNMGSPQQVQGTLAADPVAALTSVLQSGQAAGTSAGAPGVASEGTGQTIGMGQRAGTPAENEAAAKAFGVSLASMAFGPLAGLAIGKALDSPSMVGLAAQQVKSGITNSMNSSDASDALAAQANAMATALGIDPMDALMAGTDAFGTAGNAGDGGSSAEGGGIGGSGNSAGGTTSNGEGGGTAFAADGGKMQGAGNGISDSIPARLSVGEFVLSKDTVDAIEKQQPGLLEHLQATFHTPKAVQLRTGVK